MDDRQSHRPGRPQVVFHVVDEHRGLCRQAEPVYRDTRGPGLSGMRRLLAALEERSDAKAARDRSILRLAFDLGPAPGRAGRARPRAPEPGGGHAGRAGQGPGGSRAAHAAPGDGYGAEGLARSPRGRFVNFDRAGKGRRLTSTSIYRVIRGLGEPGRRQGPAPRRPPRGDHGGARPLARRRPRRRPFSRHADIRTLAVYDDNRQDLGGKMARLVAAREKKGLPLREPFLCWRARWSWPPAPPSSPGLDWISPPSH